MRQFTITLREKSPGNVAVSMHFGYPGTATDEENVKAEVAKHLIVAALCSVGNAGEAWGKTEEEARTKAELERDIRKAGQ